MYCFFKVCCRSIHSASNSSLASSSGVGISHTFRAASYNTGASSHSGALIFISFISAFLLPQTAPLGSACFNRLVLRLSFGSRAQVLELQDHLDNSLEADESVH